MAKPRVTATDRLANVIEVVELGQRTGLLSAERGSGSVLEEGEIYFASGRVIYAALAGLRGREALAVLSRWGPCRFSFERDALRPAPNIVGTQPSMPGSQPGYTPGSQPGYAPGRGVEHSGIWPGQPAYEGGDGYSAGANGYGGYGYNENGNGTGYGAGTNGFPPAFPSSPPPTGPIGYPPPYPSPARGLPTNGDLPGATGGLSLLNRRPRRAPDVRDLMAVVTTHNLSRGHRTILLLADGEHTVLDLARLSSKSVDEVSALLSELEARGLVYYYGA
jgi:hypothetical protein